ncbi:hypothetical protein H4R23_000856, partial [Coemansia sp. Cherry 401B]
PEPAVDGVAGGDRRADAAHGRAPGGAGGQRRRRRRRVQAQPHARAHAHAHV